MMVIYKTINVINNKLYVGKQRSYNERYLGSGKLIKAAIKKYGRDNFKKEIIQECFSLEELNTQETFWILKLESFKREIGYNISYGGDGGDTISNHPNKDFIIQKQKITKRKKGIGNGEKNSMYGKHLSDEHKQKISNALKDLYSSGKINRYRMTEDGKRKLSIFMKENNPMKNDETKFKDRINNIGEKNPNAHIYDFIDPNNVTYTVIGNIKSFCKKHKLSYKQIIKVHKGLIDNYNGWKCKKIKRNKFN